MPEGHTLHRIARRHSELFAGHEVVADSPQGRFVEGAARIRRIDHVEAYGKHLLYDIGAGSGASIGADSDIGADSGAAEFVHVHLGLYGKFRDGVGDPPEPRGAIRLRIVGNRHWAELRGATACEIYDHDQRAALLARLGPDPLRRDGHGSEFVANAGRSRAPVAGLLMDQKVIAGVGNVYRAELLYRARLNPYRPGRETGGDVLGEMWSDLRTLMRAGVRSGRIVTTRPADRPRGPVTRAGAHYVYRRAGEPCRIDGTEIRVAELAGRRLYWCPTCQAA